MQNNQNQPCDPTTNMEPTNIVLDGDQISLDFDGVRLVGLIVNHCAHDISVRLISPIDVPTTNGRHILYQAPLRFMCYRLLDERGNPLPELSPYGITRAADLVAELWMANKAAMQHRGQIQAAYQPITDGLRRLQEQTVAEKAERVRLRKALREGLLSSAEYQKLLAAQKKLTEKLQNEYWNECTRVREQLTPILPPNIHPARVMECFEDLDHDQAEPVYKGD